MPRKRFLEKNRFSNFFFQTRFSIYRFATGVGFLFSFFGTHTRVCIQNAIENVPRREKGDIICHYGIVRRRERRGKEEEKGEKNTTRDKASLQLLWVYVTLPVYSIFSFPFTRILLYTYTYTHMCAESILSSKMYISSGFFYLVFIGEKDVNFRNKKMYRFDRK